MPNHLKYDMGNAGDLIKHGLLAEYTKWWIENKRGKFVFYDPFGGVPFDCPLKPELSRRISALEDNCALRKAQDEPERYYGSGHIVKRIACELGRTAEIFISDNNDKALAALIKSGLTQIYKNRFNGKNGFSILDCVFTISEASLILIDPYSDFLLREAGSMIRNISKVVTDYQIPVLLFALNLEPNNPVGTRYSKLSNQFFGSLCEMTLICPTLSNTGIRGESRYISEARLIYPPGLFLDAEIVSFTERMGNYRALLEGILKVKIELITRQP